MSQFKEIAVGGTVYFWFAANLTTGAAGDGATPLYDVRLAGASSSGAPTASGTPTLLTHANYTDGLHEIAIDTTGYAEGEYAVFSTLTISTVNPAGFCGSFVVRAASSSLRDLVANIQTRIPAALTGDGNIKADALRVGGTTQTGRDLGASVLLSPGTGTGQIALTSGAVLLQATQTGVTIPTVTNLTNAPTAGDLTATMKTSVTTAATAATPTAAAVAGAVGSVTAAVALTSGERNSVADALLDRAAGVETNRTVRQVLRIVLAAVVGKLSGAAGTTVTIRDTNDTKDRVVATVDADGNRSAVTLDAS